MPFNLILIAAYYLITYYLIITVPFNLILITNNNLMLKTLKKNWCDGEQNPKILQDAAAFFPPFRPRRRRRSENSGKYVALKHRIRSICLYRHCNALHFGNKLTVRVGAKLKC